MCSRAERRIIVREQTGSRHELRGRFFGVLEIEHLTGRRAFMKAPEGRNIAHQRDKTRRHTLNDGNAEGPRIARRWL